MEKSKSVLTFLCKTVLYTLMKKNWNKIKSLGHLEAMFCIKLQSRFKICILIIIEQAIRRKSADVLGNVNIGGRSKSQLAM